MDLLLSWWNLIYLLPMLVSIICWCLVGLLAFARRLPTRSSAPAAPFLSFLGIGRLPTPVVVACMLTFWSIVGMLVNRIVWGMAENISPMLILSIPLAGASAYFGTAGLARMFSAKRTIQN